MLCFDALRRHAEQQSETLKQNGAPLCKTPVSLSPAFAASQGRSTTVTQTGR